MQYMLWKCVTGTSAYAIGYSFMDLQMMNFVNKSNDIAPLHTGDALLHIGKYRYDVRVVCTRIYSWCVQIVNVYAFNETRNVIQCKLGDELEMN